MKTEDNIISEWLDNNGDSNIENKVLNEVIDKLLQQQSEMFSGEEVIRMLNDFGNKVYGNYTRNELMCDFVEEWFEQFKK